MSQLFFLLLLCIPFAVRAQSLKTATCGTLSANTTTTAAQPQVVDGPSVRAMVVFVRFRDDLVSNPSHVPGWPLYADPSTLPPVASGLLASSESAILSQDSSLSRYFYDQSKASENGPARLKLFGDILPTTSGVPRTYVTKHDNAHYHNTNSSGYPFLVKEILDSLSSSGTDLGLYDRNDDGILDEPFVVIRSDFMQNGPLQSNNRLTLF